MGSEPGTEGTGAGASSNQINEQALQDYLARLIDAICDDLQALDARIAALESP